MKVEVDNLGIPPLAGVCSYEEASKSGYDVEQTVNLLKRYYYSKLRLHEIYTAHLPATPEWEVKCAFSLHLWLETEHCTAIRKRISEMREPPLHLDMVPSLQLEALMDEAIRAENTVELLAGIYAVIKPELARSIRQHLDAANPLADYPTCRMLRHILIEEEEMIEWGKQALHALTQSPESAATDSSWRGHLNTYLYRAGGIAGDLPDTGFEEEEPKPRADGSRYEMDVNPRRDHRFSDPYNQSARIDDYYKDESLEPDERTYALLYKRLREMDVPEWMAPILYKTTGKPWEYYSDLSRQLWDEARHAMLGEVGLVAGGVPFYSYPVCISASVVLNTKFTPLEAHLILWGIEQELMHKEWGKRWEWNIAKTSGNTLAWHFQDYDWADEVLHAQIGRKWLLQEFESREEMGHLIKDIWRRWGDAVSRELAPLSEQEEWWPDFIEEIRKR